MIQDGLRTVLNAASNDKRHSHTKNRTRASRERRNEGNEGYRREHQSQVVSTHGDRDSDRCGGFPRGGSLVGHSINLNFQRRRVECRAPCQLGIAFQSSSIWKADMHTLRLNDEILDAARTIANFYI